MHHGGGWRWKEDFEFAPNQSRKVVGRPSPQGSVASRAFQLRCQASVVAIILCPPSTQSPLLLFQRLLPSYVPVGSQLLPSLQPCSRCRRMEIPAKCSCWCRCLGRGADNVHGAGRGLQRGDPMPGEASKHDVEGGQS